MSKIRETMMSLGFNPTKAMEPSKGVEETERKVDTAYRLLDLEVLDEKIPLRTLLLIRDLSAHMENMADFGGDVVDLIRVIALNCLAGHGDALGSRTSRTSCDDGHNLGLTHMSWQLQS